MDQNLAPWTEEILFLNGDSFFKDLSQAIFTAKISIHLETYIFDQDQLGNRILQLLAETAARGVQVRLLLDGVGSSQWRHEDAQECASRDQFDQDAGGAGGKNEPARVVRDLALWQPICSWLDAA